MKNYHYLQKICLLVILTPFLLSSCKKRALPDYGIKFSDTIYVDSSSSPEPSLMMMPQQAEGGHIITIQTKNIDTISTKFSVNLGQNPVELLKDSAGVITFQIPEGTQPGSYDVEVTAKTDTGNIVKTIPLAVVPYNTVGKHKVLLFGIDGLQFRKIADAHTPNLDALNTTKAFTGGIDGTAIEQATWSGAGWMTVLNGTWVDKHTVNGNSTSTYHDQSKTVFSYIKENMPNAYTASLVTWQPIHILQGTQMNNVDYQWYGNWSRGNKIDSVCVSKAVDVIANKGPDFIFDYTVNVDDIAHQDGFGPTYQQAIETADKQLGKLMKTIKKRKETHNENWLIMVVTDHGRYSDGYSHGGEEEGTKTIFVSMNKEGNEYFQTHNTDIPNHQYNDLYGYPEQTAVTPTILRFLGIDLQDSWGFAAPPLIGKDGPRNLMFADASHKKLYWKSNSSGDAIIYKNGQKIDEIPASQGNYTDETDDGDYINDKGLITYTVSINGSTSYISTKATMKPDIHITGVMTWSDDHTVYPFRSDGQYDKFYTDSWTMSTQYGGYPADVTSGAWSQEIADHKKDINAIVRWGGNAYIFLNNNTYIKYNVSNDAYVDTRDINDDNWPGLGSYGEDINAGLEVENNLYFFLKDGTYIKYQKSGPEGALSGYPKQVADGWPGISKDDAQKISAVFLDPHDTQYAYFFLNNNTFIKYNINADKAVDGYPKDINNASWPGLLAY